MDPVRLMYDKMAAKLREQWENFRPPSDKFRFRASEAGDCGRKIWYRLTGTKPDGPFSLFAHLITRDGDLMHDQVRRDLRDAGVLLEDLTFNDDNTVDEDNGAVREFTHNGETFRISYRSDGTVLIDDVPHTLEIKTIDGFSYNYMDQAYQRGGWPRLLRYMKDEGSDPEDGKNNLGEKYKKFFAQATTVSKCTEPPVDHAYIVLKNRSLGQVGFDGGNEGLRIETTDEMFQWVLNKFAYIAKNVREGTTPLQEYTDTSRACRYCPYKARCWGKDKPCSL